MALTRTIVGLCHDQDMTPEQAPAIDAQYWALLAGGSYSRKAVESAAQAEGPVEILAASSDAGEALYGYRGTGGQRAPIACITTRTSRRPALRSFHAPDATCQRAPQPAVRTNKIWPSIRCTSSPSTPSCHG